MLFQLNIDLYARGGGLSACLYSRQKRLNNILFQKVFDHTGTQKWFDVFEYVLWFGRRAFMTYKLLQLGSNAQDNDWTLHSSSLLNSFCYKRFGIFTSVLSKRQALGLTSYYSFGLAFRTMTGYYTHVVFLFRFISKRRRI